MTSFCDEMNKLRILIGSNRPPLLPRGQGQMVCRRGRFSALLWINVSDDPDSRFFHPCGRTGATLEGRSHAEATGTGDGNLACLYSIHVMSPLQ